MSQQHPSFRSRSNSIATLVTVFTNHSKLPLSKFLPTWRLPQSTEDDSDGGYGWIIVLASFLILFATLGVIMSYGILLKQYTILFPNQASWLVMVGTLASSLTNLAAIITGPIADRVGYRVGILIGGSLFSGGIALASISTQLWQLFLTQGMLVGVGGSLLFIIGANAPVQWFDRRRGLATGIAMAGAGIGGAVISSLTQDMIESLGIESTQQILALGSGILFLIAAILMKPCHQPKPTSSCLNLKIFLDPRFLTFFLGRVAFSFAYLIPYFILPRYANECHLDSYQIAILMVCLHVGSALGRLLIGFFADLFGRLNLLLFTLLCVALLFLLVWPFSTSLLPLATFSFSYGFFTGGYVALTPVVTAQVFGIHHLPSRTGLLYFGSGIPELVGTPLATFLLQVFPLPPLPYLPLMIYAGLATLFSLACFLLLRYHVGSRR